MKKIFLLLPAFLLCGCVNAKSVSFKDNLKMTKPLSDEQVEKFEEKFKEQSKGAAQLDFETLESTKEGFVDEKVSSKGKYVFYKNGYTSSSKMKTDSSRNGVNFNYEETYQEDAWAIGKKLFTLNTSSESTESEFAVANGNEDSFISLDNLIFLLYGRDFDPLDVPDAFTEFEYFAKGAGFAVVYSNKTQQKQIGVGPGGKDYVRTTNEQMVISIDKNYKITNATYFEEVQQNRDNQTGEWYSSMQSVYKYQASINVKYGSSLSERTDLNKVYAELAKEDASYIVDVKPLLKMGAYDGTNAVAAASFTGSPAFTNYSISDIGGFQGNFKLSNNSNAFLRGLKAEVTVISKDGLKTSTTENEANINNMAALKGANTNDASPLPFWYRSDADGDELRLFVNLNVGETITMSSASVYNAE